MTYIAYKFERNGFKERLHIKAFKTMNDLDVFLCKQTDNEWNEGIGTSYPQKTGVYAFACGRYLNIKMLDPDILAYI